MRKYHGFTLIESLIVLSVVSTMVLIPTLKLTNLYQRYRCQHFFNQFEKNLHATQQSAIVSGRMSRVYYNSEKNMYFFDYNWSSEYIHQVELFLPPEVVYKNGGNLFFHPPNGNISTGALSAIIFQESITGKTITYQLTLGSGKYDKKIE